MALHRLSGKGGVSPADLTNVQLLNAGDGYNLCLDARSDPPFSPNNNGDTVWLWTCNSGATQQHWNINFSGATATITSQYGNHLCLDARSDPPFSPNNDGDTVWLWTCNGNPQQNWTVYTTSNGGYAFQNQYGNGLILGAENDSGGNPSQCGDNVQLQNWDGLHLLLQQVWFNGGNYSQCA